MSIISIKLNKNDEKMIKNYVKKHNLNLNTFIKETIIDAIEDEFIDYDKLENELKKSRKGKNYTADEVWNRLGIE